MLESGIYSVFEFRFDNFRKVVKSKVVKSKVVKSGTQFLRYQLSLSHAPRGNEKKPAKASTPT